MREERAMIHTIVPPRVYITIWALLLVFTAATVTIAGVDLGVMNVVVMLEKTNTPGSGS